MFERRVGPAGAGRTVWAGQGSAVHVFSSFLGSPRACRARERVNTACWDRSTHRFTSVHLAWRSFLQCQHLDTVERRRVAEDLLSMVGVEGEEFFQDGLIQGSGEWKV